MTRLLPLLAVASLGLATQGCIIVTDDTPSCTTEVKNSTITLSKTATGINLADVVSVQACDGDYCAATSAPDGAGNRTFGIASDGNYPRGQLRLTDLGAGQVGVNATFQMYERGGYSSLTVKLQTSSGLVRIVAGTINWNYDGCHYYPTSTIAS
ncbi:MAG: hypothetical protein IPJ34_01010 [Myxococcales bacterium]|nr:hypothetical protein [Myxococcales bacterium]